MRIDREPTADEVSQQVNDSIAAADQQRAEELDRLRIMSEAKAGSMEREAARLSTKLGSDHPRVLTLTGAIEANRGFARALVIEVQRARTEVPKADEKGWSLHGYVRDQNLKGVAGLTVAIYDEKAVWVERLGYACTNEGGYFRLAATDIRDLDRSVFVRVLNSGTLVYADKSELKPELGRVDYREMMLSGEVKVCTPPIESSAPPTKPPDTPPTKPPDTPPTKPPDAPPTKPPDAQPTKPPDVPPAGDPGASPDAWIVRGRVTDKSGKGLEGLTVSVFDKDLIFDERLGDTRTGARGDFNVAYIVKDFRDLIERKPDIYLKVMNEKGNTIYSSKDSVRYEAGAVEVFEIKIAAGKSKR